MMITQDRLKELLNYNQDTGAFIWRKSTNHVLVGSNAGWLMKIGYRSIKVDGKSYLAHRLIFLYMTGVIPKEVDHINHNKVDNSWKNLRASDRSHNMQNQSLHKNNKTGLHGVFYRNRGWEVNIRVEGKQKYLLRTCDFFEACSARKSAERKYNYHENHGQ